MGSDFLKKLSNSIINGVTQVNVKKCETHTTLRKNVLQNFYHHF